MTDTTTTITPEERQDWRERLESSFSCHDAPHRAFTLRLLTALEAAEAALLKEEVYSEELESQLQHAREENERLRAERDWLAQANSGHCGDKLTYDGVCRLPECAFSSGCLRNPTADDWKEAARRTVAAGEGE